MSNITDSFAAWCASREIDASSVSITHTEAEGIGLTAAKDLGPNEALIVVPIAAAIMHESAGAEHGTLMQSLDPTHALAIALCIATQSSTGADDVSPWTALWPPAPVGGWGYGAEAWASLSWCAEAAALHDEQSRAAKLAYTERIEPHFGGLSQACPSWERFVWALSMVSSRAAALHMSGVAGSEAGSAHERADRRLAIIPLVDLLNHRVTPTAVLTFDPGFLPAGGAFVIRTVGPVRAGSTLTICYGTKENAELLTAYGFALRRNPSDTACLKVQLRADDPLRALKMQMAPRGMAELYESVEQGRVVMGALSWIRLDEPRDAEGRPRAETAAAEGGGATLGEEELMELIPIADSSLVLVVAIAAASSMGEVVSAMSGLMGGGTTAQPDTWLMVGQACAEALAALPEAGSVAADEGIRCALLARRELLEAAARKASAGEALVSGDAQRVDGDDDELGE